MTETTTTDLTDVDTSALWAELTRRGAAVQTGYCYPAASSDQAINELVSKHGYSHGPWQLIEMGERLAAPPQWRMYVHVPEHFIIPPEPSDG